MRAKFCNRSLITIYLSLLIALGAMGCAHGKLETGGAYHPQAGTVITEQADFAFYAADLAYDLAYSTIDGVFQFERDNRALLWRISPDLKHTFDKIRDQAWGVNVQWATARSAYLSDPTPDNLSAMQEALVRIQTLATTAQAVLPKEGAK